MKKLTHPTRYLQRLVLSDGSFVETLSIASLRPSVRLAADSLTHPSWNPDIAQALLLEQSSSMASFERRYGKQLGSDVLASIAGRNSAKRQ